jgi:glycosyltransferase involved in cell wall biosynthesis
VSQLAGPAKEVSDVRISAAIVAYNEESLIGDCISSVHSLADEIVVCDLGSSDRTAEIARSLGCRVIAHPREPAPDPYPRAAAIEATVGEWVIILDPDMRVPPETAQALLAVVKEDQVDVVQFKLINFFFGRWCQHGHGSQSIFRRFFRRSCFDPQLNPASIHTFMRDSLVGRTLVLDDEFPLCHLAYSTISEGWRTLKRYAQVEANNAINKGVRGSFLRLFWRPLRSFLGSYIRRRGFLDGLQGLAISLLVASHILLQEWIVLRADAKLFTNENS